MFHPHELPLEANHAQVKQHARLKIVRLVFSGLNQSGGVIRNTIDLPHKQYRQCL